MSRQPSKYVKITAYLFFALIGFGFIEVLLRLQQMYGPLYELEFSDLSRQMPSDNLNHVPNPNFEYAGKKFNKFGIREYKNPLSCKSPKKTLFMGDSFMEGFDDKNTIPWIVQSTLMSKNICIEPINVGMSSYSPAIFIAQLRILYPLIRPEFIVIDIDETDFYDDNFRYKQFIVRDELGKNVAVKSASNYKDIAKEIDRVRSHKLYTLRLADVLTSNYLKIINSPSKKTKDNDVFEMSRLDASAAQLKFKNQIGQQLT